MAVTRRSLVHLLALAAVGCSGSDTSPTQPSRTPASLSPGTMSATVAVAPDANVYVVSVSVRESGGQTAATLRPVQLHLMRGSDLMVDATLVDAWPAQRITAGGTVATRPMAVRDDRATRPIADRITVIVTHLGDDGTIGTLAFSVPVTTTN
jgi:hypothetical protein